jgi:hypothetical protein
MNNATLAQVALSGFEIRLIAEALNHRAQVHESNIKYGMWDVEARPLKVAAEDCRELSAKLMSFVGGESGR